MTQPMEHVDYLSREIGARTAGTEEERQAALYITDVFQSESGFHTEIEDFVSSSNLELVRPLCCIVMFVVSILALLFPILCIPALILGLLAAAVYTTELLDKPIIPRSLARSESQNVVAKYQPNPNQGGQRKRTRKIVLIARYDTGTVRSGLDRMVRSMRLPVAWVSIAVMALAVVLLLIRTLFMANATGVGALIFNIICIVVAIVAVVPAIIAFLNSRAGLNEGANNNATGVAALLEVARRISRGSLSEADLSDSAVYMHGEQALRDEGLVPEGAQMVYESEQLLPPDLEPRTPEERLAKAKAALAAFTGVPGARWEPTDIAANLVDTRHGFVEPPAYDSEPVQSDEPLAKAYDSVDEYADEFANEAVDEAADDTRRAFSLPAVFEESEPLDSEEPVEEVEAELASEEASEEPNIVEWSKISDRTAVDEKPDDAGVSERFANAPDWFVQAQKKARKSESDREIRPSRYGTAIAAAEHDIQERVRAEEEAAAERERERLRESVAASKALAEAEAAAVQEEAPDQPDEAPAFEPVEDTYVPIAVAALDRDELRADMYHRPAEVAAEEDGGELEQFSDVEEDEEPLVQAEAEPAAFEDGQLELEVEPLEIEDEAEDEVAEQQPSMLRRRPIVLPSIGGESEAEGDAESASHDRLAGLPAIGADPADDDAQTLPPSRSGMIRRLRTDIPSLSGVVSPVGAAEDERSGEVFAGRVGATGSFAPVADELFDDADPEEMFIDDADDSGIEENYTGTGAYAGPGYVEMPKSRFGGLFGRRKNKEARNTVPESAQEWLDVDEDFDARQVGKKRGDWESFRPDDYDQLPQDQPKERMRDLLHDDDEAYSDDFDAYADDFDDAWDDVPARRPRGGRRWEGGAFSKIRLGRIGKRSDDEQAEDIPEDAPAVEPASLSTEMAPIEQIYHFRNPNFNTEVWFVAIGSDTRRHDGIKAFIEEHRAELRGALLMEVESLGAGELCVIQEEGLFKRQTASSRIRRLTKKTAAAVGYEPGQASISNADSLTSVAVGMGLQTMHLAGMEGDWPALKGSAGDTAENIDEETLLNNIDYITELVQRF